ncbi:histidine phosphatase family protein [Streptomyces sp. NPDC049577]|uniref:histidine phosphatase family protein n=1 Tax=Streptomyces sp. NPDC049577 TaxID=3155153 RepID=UPI00341B7E4A
MQEPFPLRCALARLTIVRHAESVANALYARAEQTGATGPVLDCADADVPLSEPGVRQARATGRWLAALGPGDAPDLVLCSPCLRATRTWDLMAAQVGDPDRMPPSALTDERLRDREAGVFELMPPTAVRARSPEEADRRRRVGEWHYRPPGGESPADVALRVRDLLTELGDAAPGRRVLVVAHDVVVIAARHVLAGIGGPAPERVPVPNASVSRWDREGTGLRLVAFGATGHLEDLPG